MGQQWTVTYRDGNRTIVDCDEMKVNGDWIGFVLHDRPEPALIVASSEVRSIEPYVEPPF
jgi:hypothetical protein